MVEPFEKALDQIAQNTKVLSEKVPAMAGTLNKLYETEKKENRREEREKIKKERSEADRKAEEKSDDVLKTLKEIKKLIENQEKEKEGGLLNDVITGATSGILGGIGVAALAGAVKTGILAALPLLTIGGSAVALVNRSKNASEQILEEQGASESTPKEQAKELSKPFNILQLLTRMVLPSLNSTEDDSVQSKSSGGFVYKSPIHAFNKGGGVYTVPGNSTGDRHPMMLPTGSFVLNRNASRFISGYQSGGEVPSMLESEEKVYAPGTWDSFLPMLNQAIPRFQTGGIVEHLHGEPGRKGYDSSHGTQSNAHDHFAFSDEATKNYVKAELQKKGYQIGSENDGVHAKNSYHYSNQAFDIPWSQFGSGPITENDYKQSRQLLADIKDILGKSGTSSGLSEEDQKKYKNDADKKRTSGELSDIRGGSSDNSNITNGGGFFDLLFGDTISSVTSSINSLFGGFTSMIGNILSGGKNTNGQNSGGNDITTTETSGPLTGDQASKAKAMYDYIKGKGYSDAQAKGVVVNIQRESNFDPSVRSGDDGGPGGLFQWKGSRQTAEVERLVNSGNWKGQIDYALQEDVGPQYKSATASMDAQSAADWWMKKWERPADPAAGSIKHSNFLSSYKFQEGGKVPVMVESGEKIFSPGSFGPELEMINDAIPRFQSGGSVNVSRGMNPIQELFKGANKSKLDLDVGSNQPIIIPVPQAMPAAGQVTNSNTSGSHTPDLPNEPSNHIVSTLVMQTYALMNRIG